MEAVRPLVIAHRGASGTRPENTLSAFRRAEEIGAHMVELDVQTTRDGHVIVLHDETLERTTDGAGLVAERSLAELRALDAGRWFDRGFTGERIPTLSAVLDAIRLPVNVELKAGGGPSLVDATLAVVAAAGALDRVVFSSFDGSLLVELHARCPRAALAVLWTEPAILDALRLAERVSARTLHIRKDAVRGEVIAQAAAAGVEVRAWTVNDPIDSKRLVEAGATGIFTDFPERFLHTDTPGSQATR